MCPSACYKWVRTCYGSVASQYYTACSVFQGTDGAVADTEANCVGGQPGADAQGKFAAAAAAAPAASSDAAKLRSYFVPLIALSALCAFVNKIAI